MTIEEKQNALIAAANAVTGGTDADITAVIQRLVDGYGKGGGLPEGIAEINAGSLSATDLSSDVNIQHGLSDVPTGFLIYLDDFTADKDDTDNTLWIAAAHKTVYDSTDNTVMYTQVGRRTVATKNIWAGGSISTTQYFKFSDVSVTIENRLLSAKMQPIVGGQTAVYKWVAWR